VRGVYCGAAALAIAEQSVRAEIKFAFYKA
jgi:hypothetical protein